MWNAVLWLHKVAVLYIKPQPFTGQQFGSSAKEVQVLKQGIQIQDRLDFTCRVRASIAKMSSSMLLLWTAVLAALFARGKRICL